MAIRTLIATALMASACVAHADVIPSSDGAGIVSGSNVAGAVGDSSVIAGVTHGANSDAIVQALYEKVSASVGKDMKVSLKQGVDGVYVTGLSTAKAAALAGDGMSVVATPDGYKIVDTSGNQGNLDATVGGGADVKVGIGNGQQAATDVPEPSTVALMLAGLMGVAGLGRRRAR